MLLIIALLLAGCGARREYYLSHLEVAQQAWDSVAVDVEFGWRTVVGPERSLEPDSAIINVFDSRYDTLYSGAGPVVPVPDGELGDREPITFEVCGYFEERTVCLQQVRKASPKRILVSHDITYPDGSRLDRGLFALDFSVERRRYEEDVWEPVQRHGRVSGYLLAWVENRDRAAIQMPFNTARGRFDLTRHKNYRDFKFYLDSRLLDEEEAYVHFDVFAALRGEPVRIATVRKRVALKSEEERGREVRAFVQQATERIVDELGGFLGTRGAVAYVDDWTFSRRDRRYSVAMEVQWRSLLGNSRYELFGTLDVQEDGSGAVFRFRDANGRAERRWRERVRGESLRLGELAPVAAGGEDAP